MIEITTHEGTAAGWMPEAADVQTRRAVCEDCGAHAAVITAGASITGACSVCGSHALHLLDGRTPPPRHWVP